MVYGKMISMLGKYWSTILALYCFSEWNPTWVFRACALIADRDARAPDQEAFLIS